MVRSTIINEFGNGKVPLSSIMTRALIIATELENQPLIEWINNELYGYDSLEKLPKYRFFSNSLRISYFAFDGSKFIDQSFDDSIIKSDKIRKSIPNYIKDGLNTIEVGINSEKSSSYNLNVLIDYLKNVVGINAFSFTNRIDKSVYLNIIAKVKQILLTFLLKAEKEFGNLDQLDVDTDEKKKFNQSFNITIENLVNIGSNNTIKETNIAGESIEGLGKKR